LPSRKERGLFVRRKEGGGTGKIKKAQKKTPLRKKQKTKHPNTHRGRGERGDKKKSDPFFERRGGRKRWRDTGV